MANDLHRNPEAMKFIREHCETVSKNEMARVLGVAYSTIKAIGIAGNLNFAHYGHKRLPFEDGGKRFAPLSLQPPPRKKNGTGRGVYKKKPIPAPEPEKKVQRAPGVYSNQSPYGIASDERHL